MLNWSWAVTVKLKAVPAVALAGALTAKCVAAAAFTAMVLLVPVIDEVVVSVAVSVWLPAVFKVAVKVPTPLVSVEFAGSTAWPSLLVKWTVPVYPVAVLLNWSWAVTVKLKATPAVALEGALTLKWVAAAALTVMVLLVPVMELLTLSVAVMVWLPAVFSVALKLVAPLVRVLLAGKLAIPSVLVK